jgi:hypothetical protein
MNTVKKSAAVVFVMMCVISHNAITQTLRQELEFTNTSPFKVSIRQGSYGGNEVCVIKGGSRVSVKVNIEAETIYYPLYDIPLTANYVLKNQIDSAVFFVVKPQVRITIQVPPPRDLENSNAYLVVRNKSSGSVSLMRGSSFVPLLPEKKETTLNAGESGVYQGAARQFDNLSFYHSSAIFPKDTYNNGYVYYYDFDGREITLVEARLLAKIADPLVALVSFSGAIPEAEQQMLLAELNTALQKNKMPLIGATKTDATMQNQQVHYGLNITLATTAQEAKPPFNIATIKTDVALAFLRNGTTLQIVSKSFNEIDTSGVYRVVAAFIRDNSQFYQSLINYMP